MLKVRGAIATVIVIGSAIAAAVPAPAAPVDRPGTLTARCERAMVGSGSADWRREAISAGPVGVLKRAMDNFHRSRSGKLRAKMPMLVESRSEVTVSAPPAIRPRILLEYGEERYGKAVRFLPCPDKPRTIWPGGISVIGREAIRLRVDYTVGGEPRTSFLKLGRPRLDGPRS